MRFLPRYYLMGIISLCAFVPGFAQINPIKTVKEIGKNLPVKKDPPATSGTPTSAPNAAPTTNNTSTTGTTLDATAESSPAKSFISSFWKSIDKLKAASAAQQYHLYSSSISSAETNLNNIKMRDPAYNLQPLESELAKYKAEYKSHNNQRTTSRDNAANTVRYLSSLFRDDPTDYISTGVDNMEADIAKHKEKLQAFKDKCDQFLASNPDPAQIKEWETHANQDAAIVPNEVTKLEKSIEANTGKHGLVTYQDLLSLDAFWTVVCKIYPNLSAPATALQSVKAALTRLGTEAQMLAKFQKNLTEKIKNARMPAATHSDANIDAEFKKAFANMGWGETILKINLLSNDWSTLYHTVTGNIIARSYRAAIGAKQPNGNCIIYDFTIVQEHTGAGKYGASKRYEHGVFADQCLCENIR